MTVPAPPTHVKVTVTFPLFHPAALGAGLDVAEIVRPGPSVTLRLEVAVLRATPVARMVTAFGPEANVRLQEKFAPFNVAVAPLQVTFATPESASATVPLTASCGLVTVAAGAGETMARVGLVLSILRVAEAVAVLPTASVAVREMTWFAPSFEMTTDGGQVTGNAPPEQLNATVTSLLFQPAALGAGVAVAEMVRVLKLKVTFRIDVAVFPALSVAWTVIAFAPGTSGKLHEKADPVTAAVWPLQVKVATPDVASVTVTVTAGLWMTAPLAGDAMVRTGAVLSRLMGMDFVTVFPAPSFAEPEIGWVLPSVVTRTMPGQESDPPAPPAQMKVKVTSPLFQPAAFGVGALVASIESGLSALAMSTAMLPEGTRCEIPRKAAVVRKKIRPGVGSFRVNTRV